MQPGAIRHAPRARRRPCPAPARNPPFHGAGSVRSARPHARRRLRQLLPASFGPLAIWFSLLKIRIPSERRSRGLGKSSSVSCPSIAVLRRAALLFRAPGRGISCISGRVPGRSQGACPFPLSGAFSPEMLPLKSLFFAFVGKGVVKFIGQCASAQHEHRDGNKLLSKHLGRDAALKCRVDRTRRKKNASCEKQTSSNDRPFHIHPPRRACICKPFGNWLADSSSLPKASRNLYSERKNDAGLSTRHRSFLWLFPALSDRCRKMAILLGFLS